MLSLQAIQKNITRSYGRGSLLLRKHSPEILLGAGLVGVVVSAVLASKATLKVEQIIGRAQSDIKLIKSVEVGEDAEYTEDDRNKDLAVVYVQTGIKLGQLYGPALGIGALSITAILAAHGIMTRRQVAIVGAYNLLQEGYKSYRERVIEELGEEKDRQYRLGIRETEYTETITNEDGTKTKVKSKAQVYDPRVKSVYARFFDESSVEWQRDPTMNLFFLVTQQNYANDMLKARGHLFLNEVYRMLGLPETKEGCVVGWIINNPVETGDEYVSFDIYNVDNAPGRDFVNGYNNSILLDFNVDGVIYDLI